MSWYFSKGLQSWNPHFHSSNSAHEDLLTYWFHDHVKGKWPIPSQMWDHGNWISPNTQLSCRRHSPFRIKNMFKSPSPTEKNSTSGVFLYHCYSSSEQSKWYWTIPIRRQLQRGAGLMNLLTNQNLFCSNTISQHNNLVETSGNFSTTSSERDSFICFLKTLPNF